ncbi:FAM43B [Pelobates cultripes]|uniref:FAM43B n=1 Tax=Pelobates cultripes TaxID=61616 RepID=A0AAD1WQQ5_PELCU|nr:FAM43B [Pelobates cultripes]
MPSMLPWRRSKVVLVKKERKGKILSYSSALTWFLGSCPDLLHQIPLERLGRVFSSRRQKVELNREDPCYTVWYLGNAVTLHAKGEGCMLDSVQKIWQKSEFGGCSSKMKLSLGTYGIRMSPCGRGSRKPVHAYLLHRITYCGVDSGHPKIFSWIYRHQVKNKAVVLRCHAVLLSKADNARAMALLLCQTSMAAFNEFKRLKRQSDFRRGQQELLGQCVVPLVPLRKLLNGVCSYNPPADRHRSPSRLSSILEEEEDKEEGLDSPRGYSMDTCYVQQERDKILELANELRRLSIQRALCKKHSCTCKTLTQLSEWKPPIHNPVWKPPIHNPVWKTPTYNSDWKTPIHNSDWKHPVRTIC